MSTAVVEMSPSALPPADAARKYDRRSIAIVVLMVAISAVLLLASLGAYPLWADEADTALFARGVWETGDTSALVGDNIYAYRDGMMLEGLKNRYTPPLPYYLEAPFYGLAGYDPAVLRLPFALCGLACVAVIGAWLLRARARPGFCLLIALALVGNTSFFLYARQARYYALATLASLVIVYFYATPRSARSRVCGMLAGSIVLLATQYINFAALYTGLAIDYAVWGYRERRLKLSEVAMLVVPQIALGLVLVSIWNPLGKADLVGNLPENSFVDKLTLLTWNLRDIQASELAPGLLLLAGAGWAVWRRDAWLLRASAAMVVYCAATALASPQPVATTGVADVRYLAPLCLLGVWAVARFADRASRGKLRWSVPLLLVGCFTTVLDVPWSIAAWRSTPLEFVGELIHPHPTAIAAASRWLEEHARPGKSVYVAPRHLTYPLMVRDDGLIYGWQLKTPPRPQFAKLPTIYFIGAESLDYLVAFGPDGEDDVDEVRRACGTHGVRYEKLATLDAYWDDATRPEMFWHDFAGRQAFDKAKDAVYIYGRVH